MSAGDVLFVGWTGGSSARFKEYQPRVEYSPITEFIYGFDFQNHMIKKLSRRIVCFENQLDLVIQNIQVDNAEITCTFVNESGGITTKSMGGGWTLQNIVTNKAQTGFVEINIQYEKIVPIIFEIGLPDKLNVTCENGVGKILYNEKSLTEFDTNDNKTTLGMWCGIEKILGSKDYVLPSTYNEPYALNYSPMFKLSFYVNNKSFFDFVLTGKDIPERTKVKKRFGPFTIHTAQSVYDSLSGQQQTQSDASLRPSQSEIQTKIDQLMNNFATDGYNTANIFTRDKFEFNQVPTTRTEWTQQELTRLNTEYVQEFVGYEDRVYSGFQGVGIQTLKDLATQNPDAIIDWEATPPIGYWTDAYNYEFGWKFNAGYNSGSYTAQNILKGNLDVGLYNHPRPENIGMMKYVSELVVKNPVYKEVEVQVPETFTDWVQTETRGYVQYRRYTVEAYIDVEYDVPSLTYTPKLYWDKTENEISLMFGNSKVLNYDITGL